MSDDRPRLAGWILPLPSTVLWLTVAGSILAYVVYSRAVANVVAIVGGIALTVVLVVRDKST
ncbi:MAG: hypothetical protein HKN91_02810 [Acidimicrobiia bacterium]|nr:hypothetical protein [Acidimicrobiia bacterium]